MKSQTELLREEIARIIGEQALRSPSQSPEFPKDLVERVVKYVAEQRRVGKTIVQCIKELGMPKGRMQYWLYQRGPRVVDPPPPPVLREVEVSSEVVPVYDGVPERRYTLSSPAGWELRDLSFSELVELLRSLA